jgi:hypothetical protein
VGDSRVCRCATAGVCIIKGQEYLSQVLDRLESEHQEQVLLEDAHESLGDAVALGLAYIGRRILDPSKDISLWKSSEMNWLPGSWRRVRPAAMSLTNAPKLRRTPVDRIQPLSAWMPTSSREQ